MDNYASLRQQIADLQQAKVDEYMMYPDLNTLGKPHQSNTDILMGGLTQGLRNLLGNQAIGDTALNVGASIHPVTGGAMAINNLMDLASNPPQATYTNNEYREPDMPSWLGNMGLEALGITPFLPAGMGMVKKLGKADVNPWNYSPTSKEWSEFSIDDIDRAAFGFAEGDIKKLNPNELEIKWVDDLDQVNHEIKTSGKSPQQWAEGIDLSEPIEVIVEDGVFKIDDGHHRYMAAKILNKELPVDVAIKDQPFKALAEKAELKGESIHPDLLKAATDRGYKPKQ